MLSILLLTFHCYPGTWQEVACRTVLKRGVFTTGIFDNFDYDPTTSTSVLTVFHGTAVPLTHH